jgi:hypothetical protein
VHGTEAVEAARAVVGWYGDPTVSWSVLLQASLHPGVETDPVDVATRLAATVERYPHLGMPPAVQAAGDSEWAGVLARLADQPYTGDCPLVRVAVGSEKPRLVIAAHHGVTDGLGLIALLGEALGTTVRSAARGIGERAAGSSFAATAARRLAEAVLRPPARIAADRGQSRAVGDVLCAMELPETAVGTGALIAATAAAVTSWNRQRQVPAERQVAGIGVSRRGGEQLSPELDSAFLRLRLPPRATSEQVGRLILEQPPEPAYPSTRSLAPQAVTRALASRLGSTFLVSNHGRVDAGQGVRSLAFHPTASGRSGVAIGAVTTGETTTITMRARRRDFGQEAVGELLGGIVDRLHR